MEVSLYRRPVLRVPPEGGCGSPPGRSGKARGRFGRDGPRCPWAASRPPCGVRTRWGSGTPGQNGDGPCCTTPQHNAHVTGIPDDREVFYAWHPWAGKTVRVHKVTRHPTGAVARCTAVEGDSAERAQELPVWMLDAAWCRPMHRADEPVPSLDALRALQALLGEVTGGAEATERNPIRSAGPRSGERDASSPPPGDSVEPPSGSVLDASAHDAKLGASSGSDPSGRDHSARARSARLRARAESGAGERRR